jgi:predicted aminopeptidase
VDFCRNLDSGARISVYRQWIATFKQLIGMIGEDYYHYVTQIRLYSAERAGGWGKDFSAPFY